MKRLLSNPKGAVLCAVAALLLVSPAARAASDKQVADAVAYLRNTDRAKGILFFCHPTATYKSVQVSHGGVTRAGRAVPGEFHVKLHITWKNLLDDTNTSDVICFFDDRGRLTDLRAGHTTSFFRQFGAADAVIGAIKDELNKEIAKWQDAVARRTATNLIDSADARRLLLLILQQGQP